MKTIINKVFLTALFVILPVIALAQQPTHYPKANEPIPWTLGNILLYIGGPIILFFIYYFFRRREKKKRMEEKNRKS